jgi:hypothetical protein
MGLTQTDSKTAWKLDHDPNDLETVWAGSARRLIPVDGVVVLSSGGDRVFLPGTPPVDVTEKLGLRSRSRAMASGDFNGDGRQSVALFSSAASSGTAATRRTDGHSRRLNLRSMRGSCPERG